VTTMKPRDAFLDELRQQTTRHLQELAAESAETLGRFIAMPELGQRIYQRLVEVYQMDGAQEIAAALVDLVAGALDKGTVMLTEREYRGLRLIRDEFHEELPDAVRENLHNLIQTLAKADRQ